MPSTASPIAPRSCSSVSDGTMPIIATACLARLTALLLTASCLPPHLTPIPNPKCVYGPSSMVICGTSAPFGKRI
eukprot:6904520-Prymnesium_polylepis.2